MSVGGNIRRIRREKRLTLDAVASKADTDTGNLSRLERGLQSYTDEGVRKIAKVLGVPVQELFADAPTVTYEPARAKPKVVSVPEFDVEASMGPGTAQPSHETVVGSIQLSETWLRRNVNATHFGHLAVISAYGDSMAPTFNDGDVLLVDTTVETLTLDAVYVLGLNSELYIKRVQRRPDRSIVIKSDNPLYDPHVVTAAERDTLRVYGRVLWAWNGRKL